MNKRLWLFLFTGKSLAGFVVSGLLFSSAVAAVSPAEVEPERYQLIEEHNIFLRDRNRSTSNFTPGPPPPPPAAVPAPEERYLVLSGIARFGEEYVAFIEHARERNVSLLRVGDPVARGQLVEINLDGLRYDNGSQVTRVGVGNNLEGVETAPSGESRTRSGGSGASEDQVDIIERLRRRRQEEID